MRRVTLEDEVRLSLYGRHPGYRAQGQRCCPNRVDPRPRLRDAAPHDHFPAVSLMFQLLQTVRLRRDLPEQDLARGTRGQWLTSYGG